MLDHLETGRDVFEHLPLILSDPAERCAAAAWAGAGGLVGDGLARQMGWQRRADRLLARVGLGRRLVVGLSVRLSRADASIFSRSLLFDGAHTPLEYVQ